MTLTTPPIASEPYRAEAGPLRTSIRWILSKGMVARLVAPAGRPSISNRVCLVVPENSGRKPRILIPERDPGYWITSTLEVSLRTSVRSVATVSLISLVVITLTTWGSSFFSSGVRVAVTTISSNLRAFFAGFCAGAWSCPARPIPGAINWVTAAQTIIILEKCFISSLLFSFNFFHSMPTAAQGIPLSHLCRRSPPPRRIRPGLRAPVIP
ncbi:hypothetical protein BMS3Abin13_00820 [bacterium BMS3Abin13]|nr:hypothetical protein BMS3Abin13_00820 [bacterium BMS3Abin13]